MKRAKPTSKSEKTMPQLVKPQWPDTESDDYGTTDSDSGPHPLLLEKSSGPTSEKPVISYSSDEGPQGDGQGDNYIPGVHGD